MLIRRLIFACFLPLILFNSSVYGFIEGLYCGTENCYDGKKVLFIFVNLKLLILRLKIVNFPEF